MPLAAVPSPLHSPAYERRGQVPLVWAPPVGPLDPLGRVGLVAPPISGTLRLPQGRPGGWGLGLGSSVAIIPTAAQKPHLSMEAEPCR